MKLTNKTFNKTIQFELKRDTSETALFADSLTKPIRAFAMGRTQSEAVANTQLQGCGVGASRGSYTTNVAVAARGHCARFLLS